MKKLLLICLLSFLAVSLHAMGHGQIEKTEKNVLSQKSESKYGYFNDKDKNFDTNLIEPFTQAVSGRMKVLMQNILKPIDVPGVQPRKLLLFGKAGNEKLLLAKCFAYAIKRPYFVHTSYKSSSCITNVFNLINKKNRPFVYILPDMDKIDRYRPFVTWKKLDKVISKYPKIFVVGTFSTDQFHLALSIRKDVLSLVHVPNPDEKMSRAYISYQLNNINHVLTEKDITECAKEYACAQRTCSEIRNIIIAAVQLAVCESNEGKDYQLTKKHMNKALQDIYVKHY